MTTSKVENHALICSNVASEKAVLSGIISYGIDALVDVQSIVEENTFTIDANKIIYQCLKKALKTANSIDLTSILSASSQLGFEEYTNSTGGLKHVKHLMNYEVELENIRSHAIRLKRLQFARELRAVQTKIFTELGKVDGDEEISDILSIPETNIQSVSLQYIREDRSVPKLIGEKIHEYTENLESQEVGIPGICTGYPYFDRLIGGGARRGCVDLIGSRAKTGKSTLADNIAIYVGSAHGDSKAVPVLLIDTEMNAEDHYDRLLANLSGVPINKISTSEYSKKIPSTGEYETPELVKSIKSAADKIKQLNYHYINVAGRKFEETLAVIRRWLFKNVGYDENGRMNDCLVIYDYLKMMSSNDITSNVAEFQALGFQITQLHNFTVEYDFPCISFVQLNRDGITRETEDSISGSDRLIWLCSSFSIFKKKTQEEIMNDGVENGNRKLINVVSRHGPGTENSNYICMNMIGELSRVEELGPVAERTQNGIPDREDSDVETEGELQSHGDS